MLGCSSGVMLRCCCWSSSLRNVECRCTISWWHANHKNVRSPRNLKNWNSKYSLLTEISKPQEKNRGWGALCTQPSCPSPWPRLGGKYRCKCLVSSHRHHRRSIRAPSLANRRGLNESRACPGALVSQKWDEHIAHFLP